ncbi:MAG: archaellin/type IV pilin N-terminal domain-containing protein [Thermoplasmata archaeon]
MWTESARSWRKNKKRAVSPIIATILLVAITVVLAAVLYILISGLTKGPGNTPLGTAFGFGSITEETGSATGCASSHLCYSIPVASASSGMTVSDLNFQLKSPTGVIETFTGVTVLSISGTSQAVYSGSWNNPTIALSSSQTLVVDTGGSTDLVGYTLVAIGSGSYSGQVSTTLP